MKISILTDHSLHSGLNSFYGIANALLRHNDVSQVNVASRAVYSNEDFFKGVEDSKLYGTILNEEINYPDGTSFSSKMLLQLENSDAVLLRVPHPIQDLFFDNLKATLTADRIINQPDGIREVGNKAFLTELDQFTVPMEICKSFGDIYNFSQEYECILKPLKGYGGQGILRINNGVVLSPEGRMSMDDFQEEYYNNPQTFLAMKFLKNVKNGDKRIVVANGELISCSLRLPTSGKWLCNVSQGGTDDLSSPTSTEMQILDYLTPILKERGIFYYGLDTLEDDNGERIISEINVLSPGGMTPVENKSNIKVTENFANVLVEYLKNNL